jgi:hypothetical protein
LTPSIPYRAIAAMYVFVPIVSAICPFGTIARDVAGLAVTVALPSCTQTGVALVFVTKAIVGVPVVGNAAREDVADAFRTIVAVGANEAIAMRACLAGLGPKS